MVIQWYGQSCFKITSGEFVLVVDPFSKEVGLTPPRFKTDVALVTHSHFDHANTEALAGEPAVVSGPGEYEVRGVYVRGLETYHDKSKGRERGLNTIYEIELEELRILHLGDFGEGAIRDEILDQIEDTDILMVPVGGKFTIDGEEATKVVKQLEPKIVIPMHYKVPGITVGLDSAEKFLKEIGASKNEPQERLTIKKKDLVGKEKTEVVILKLANS